MTLPDRIKLPLAFDPRPLESDVAGLSPDAWIPHFVQQNYEGDWNVVPLRAPKGATHPVKMIYSDPTASVFVDTPFLAQCPGIRAALASLACGLRAVRLMRLTPGSEIKEHDDLDLDADLGFARLHVPITTNPGVSFTLNGEPLVMLPGSAWYLRLSDRHRAANKGETDRVHLVVDVVVNDWLRDLLERGARDAALDVATSP